MSRQALGMAVWLTVPALTLAAAPQAQTQSSRQAQVRFQAMDQNRDGVVSRAEWRGSAQSFRRHDWNGDGVLSNEEVRVGAAREPGEPDDYDQTRRPEFRNWTDRGFTISIATATAGLRGASGSTTGRASFAPTATATTP